MLTFAGEHFTFYGGLREPEQPDSPVPELCVTMLLKSSHLAERWLSGRKQRFAKPS